MRVEAIRTSLSIMCWNMSMTILHRTSRPILFRVHRLRTWVLALALAFPLQVWAQAGLSISPDSLPPAYQGVYYLVNFSATGGTAPYKFQTGSFPGLLFSGLSMGTDGTLSGIPNQGTYTFTVTATDNSSATNTSTRNYTLVVDAQPILVAPGSLPVATVGRSYAQTLTASGGNAPYRFVLAAGSRLAPGLTLSSDGVIGGTVRNLGAFGLARFSVQVTDVTGLTVTVPYEQQIVLPQFGAAPGVLPHGTSGVPYSQAITASGGIAPYRFRVVGSGCGPNSTPSSGCGSFVTLDSQNALPPGLRLEQSGSITGTPTRPGTYTFEYLIEDATFPEPVSVLLRSALTGAIRTATISIASAPMLTIAPVALPDGDADQTYRQQLSASGGTAPYRYALASGSLPPGLALDQNGLLAGTATTAGAYAFAIQASDSASPAVQGVQQYALVIRGPALEGASFTVASTSGVPVEVDLTRSARGGPFSDATIVSLTPSGAGTATIAGKDVGGVRQYLLTFTPSATFAGNAVLRYTLSAGTQTSPQATITFAVVPRPDPSKDTEVLGQLNAQVDTARRFAGAQGRNFGQRLERLHDMGGRQAFEGGLGLSIERPCVVADRTDCDRSQGNTLFFGPERSRDGDAADVSVWVAGNVTSGDQDGRDGGAARFDFQTDGISIGADIRVSDALAWGGGVGYGRDTSRIGGNGTRNRADASTLAMYVSYRRGKHFFVDGLMGWQGLGYELRRHVAATGRSVKGRRDGDQWFGAVTAGADLDRGAWRFTPYARLDLAHAALDAYRESGDPVFALAYDDLDVDTVVGNLGLRVEYRLETRWGAFEPRLRIEYQHNFHGAGDALMRYADLNAGAPYRASLSESQSGRFGVGIGTAFRFDHGWYLRFEYRGEAGDDTRIEQGIQTSVDKTF